MNLRLLRLAAILLGNVGLGLVVLDFVFRLGLDSIVNLIALPLIITGLILWFWWFSLKGKEARK